MSASLRQTSSARLPRSDTTKAAAILQVSVGAMNNPSRWPGLAHFCEHMLFLGTARYPDEGEFARFISANGGRNRNRKRGRGGRPRTRIWSP